MIMKTRAGQFGNGENVNTYNTDIRLCSCSNVPQLNDDDGTSHAPLDCFFWLRITLRICHIHTALVSGMGASPC